MSDAETAQRLLRTARTIAVVGASRHLAKAAHRIPADLAAAGYRVIPVNPTPPPDAGEDWDGPVDRLFGEPVVAQVSDIDEPVDLVDVFRPPRECPQVAADAVAIGAKALWLQLGIVSPEARRIVEEAGLDYVEDRCTGADRRRWGIRPPGDRP